VQLAQVKSAVRWRLQLIPTAASLSGNHSAEGQGGLLFYNADRPSCCKTPVIIEVCPDISQFSSTTHICLQRRVTLQKKDLDTNQSGTSCLYLQSIIRLTSD